MFSSFFNDGYANSVTESKFPKFLYAAALRITLVVKPNSYVKLDKKKNEKPLHCLTENSSDVNFVKRKMCMIRILPKHFFIFEMIEFDGK